MDFTVVINTAVGNAEDRFFCLPSVDTVPVLKQILPLLPTENVNYNSNQKPQGDFTDFEGKVMSNMGFLVLQVKRGVRRPLGGGVWSFEPGSQLLLLLRHVLNLLGGGNERGGGGMSWGWRAVGLSLSSKSYR